MRRIQTVSLPDTELDAHRRVLACGELPDGRSDLPARQRAAANARSPSTTSSRGCSGHWGTSPGLNLVYAHLEPRDRARRPRHDLRDRPRPRRSGDPREHLARGQLHRDVSRDHARRRGDGAAVPPVLVPGRRAEPRRARDAGFDPRGRRARLLDRARVRRRVRQSRSGRRVRRRRRRGRDRPARDELALEQVPRPGRRRRGAPDPAPQRLQDREPDGARAHPRGRARRAALRVRLGAVPRRRRRSRAGAPASSRRRSTTCSARSARSSSARARRRRHARGRAGR